MDICRNLKKKILRDTPTSSYIPFEGHVRVHNIKGAISNEPPIYFQVQTKSCCPIGQYI